MSGEKAELLIFHEDKVKEPSVIEGVVWQTERRNAPGKLTFGVIGDKALEISEGDAVRFRFGDNNVFYGYVFTLKSGSEGVISVTAYDQLRYLKNKDTYVYENKTAAEVVKMIAKDFGLQTGVIDDTGYKIPSRVENNSTLFDIIGNALELTAANRGKTFVLYDDFGKLTLRGLENMRVGITVDRDTCGSVEGSSSIDSNTFNRVKLVYENDKTGQREVYISKDDESVKRWGVLQYFGTLKKDENGSVKAKTLLEKYKGGARSLDAKNVLGDCRVRAGSVLTVVIKDGGADVAGFMTVEKCRHVFKGGVHLMDLSLGV